MLYVNVGKARINNKGHECPLHPPAESHHREAMGGSSYPHSRESEMGVRPVE